MNALERRLCDEFGARLALNRSLADFTSFKIGGPADLFIVVENEEELSRVIMSARDYEVPSFCLGSGTNLLISDRGIRGLVVKLGGGFANIEIDGLHVRSGAAAQFCDLATTTADQGLAGLEFGEGIPGSVGGGLMMNAGAFGGEMARVVTAVHGIDQTGMRRVLSNDEVGFAYRRTRLPERFVITQVDFRLSRGDAAALRAHIAAIHERRLSRQPRDLPNAGSIFKNPNGTFAGRLLEQVGLKGHRQGAAAFSDQHANFIVNLGGASATDVRALIDLARTRVAQDAGVMLEPEVRIVGDW
jgi:UDP-N-acetylmuramate dehydrogenase